MNKISAPRRLTKTHANAIMAAIQAASAKITAQEKADFEALQSTQKIFLDAFDDSTISRDEYRELAKAADDASAKWVRSCGAQEGSYAIEKAIWAALLELQYPSYTAPNRADPTIGSAGAGHGN